MTNEQRAKQQAELRELLGLKPESTATPIPASVTDGRLHADVRLKHTREYLNEIIEKPCSQTTVDEKKLLAESLVEWIRQGGLDQ
jgi:hypothetical protein